MRNESTERLGEDQLPVGCIGKDSINVALLLWGFSLTQKHVIKFRTSFGKNQLLIEQAFVLGTCSLALVCCDACEESLSSPLSSSAPSLPFSASLESFAKAAWYFFVIDLPH
jgi:hypothetical protein